MRTLDWRPFLENWSREWLSIDEYRWDLPDEVAASGRLGHPGATAEEIDAAERRLGVALPPSYRQFLATSNVRRRTSYRVGSHRCRTEA